MKKIIHNLLRKTPLLILLLINLTISTAIARDYMVEVLIFENLDAHPAYESQHYIEPAELEPNADVWFLEPSMLMEEAQAIRNSADYKLLRHLSWGQESLPLSESAAFNVIETDINGWIKVYANQLLFANLDLDFNGYRMNEKRRLKLNEKHFFDHPKFGILMQVSRLLPPEEPEEETESP